MKTRTQNPYIAWGVALATLIVTTLLMLVIRGALDKVHIALIYLIIVLAGSAAGGQVLGFALAGLTFLAFNFFFLPPYGTFALADPLNWLVLMAFLVTSLIAAQLLRRLQNEAAEARARAAEVERLSALGSEALSVVHARDALHAIAEVIRTTLGIDQCDVYVRDESNLEPTLVARVGTSIAETATQDILPTVGPRSLLAWVCEHGIAAAERMDGTFHVSTIRDNHADDVAMTSVAWSEFAGVRTLTIPLRVRQRVVGVLRMANAAGIQLVPEQQVFLDALTHYAALGVERVRLAADAESVDTMREADRLKNALLAAVSHDLRTPLTTIKALAHEVTVQGAVAGDTRVRSIEDEADHLALLVADLLDLSRLTGGALQLNLAVNTAEDLIGAAVSRVSGVLGQHPLHVQHDPDAPILFGYFDFVHALRTLVNLLENAAKHSPGASPIELSVHRDVTMLVFSVADCGPGVPLSERERIFEPFYRPPGVPPDVRGAGLGLAIARGLAEAQGGVVRYTPREGGGSVFQLVLPATEVSLEILSKF